MFDVPGVPDMPDVVGAESEDCGVEGVALGESLEPDCVGEGESGFCDGVELSSEPPAPEVFGAEGLCEPPLWPGSLLKTLLW